MLLRQRAEPMNLLRLEHQALLAEHVAARLQHIRSDVVMREERREDEHRIQIFAIQQIVVIAISSGVVANGLNAVRERRGPNIAKGQAFSRVNLFQVLQQITAAAARANDAILHLIVGCFDFLNEGSGSHRGGCACRLDQVAAGEIVILCHEETPMIAIVSEPRRVRAHWPMTCIPSDDIGNTMANSTVSDLLIERLISWNVEVVFGFPGDGVNGIFEALRTHSEKIRFIQVRHEEAAALAACGYAKFTGRLGVCVATSGPGGIHLMNGLYDAKCDGQPVLAITGHTFHDLIGTHYQQDVDLDKLFMDVAAYNQRVMGPAHVINVVDEAIKTSLARRTVSHITIPKDMQEMPESKNARSAANIQDHSGDLFAASYPMPPERSLRMAADLINQGKKVAMLVGRGCLNARQEVLELAELTGSPIVKALLGKAVVPDRNPYTTGGIGLLGTAPSQDALKECDTFIMAGTSFPYMEFLPKPGQAKSIQIDIEPTRIGLRHPADVGLAGDCRTILRALIPLVERKTDRAFLTTCQKRMAEWNDLMQARGTRTDMPMKPQVVMWNLNKLLDGDAIVSADSGTITTWAARHIEMRDEMKFSVSGMLATMANGLPYSIGAAVAYPGRQVVCIIGDGGLAMLMGEIATLVKYNLPVKVIVIKNNVLGQIKCEQLVMEANPEYGVELQPIDFAAVARACGATGFTIDNPSDAEDTLRRAFAHPGPVVVEAVVDGNEPPLPGNVTAEQALNFAKALGKGEKDRWKIIRTVLEDKIREVI
jgi:pyruvate dehydrogenase (quinone)